VPDSPDWSKYLPLSKRYSLQDLGELAARLKSLNVYDRRGEVIWWEDWCSGINHWSALKQGTNADVYLVGSIRYLSPFVARLDAGITLERSITLFSYLSPLHLSKIGVEIAFAPFSEFSYLQLSLHRYDGSVLTKAEVRLSDDTDELLYLNSSGTYQSFASDIAIVQLPNLFHNLKLVVDFDTDEYLRALYDETEYDLSGIAARTEVSTTEARTYLAIQLVSTLVTSASMYCGQVLVTSNEP